MLTETESVYHRWQCHTWYTYSTILTNTTNYILTYLMKPLQFEGNTNSCNFEYFRVREGPNYFVSFYKNSSRLHYDPKDCWRVLGQAKFTDSGKALKEWCLSMYDEYSVPQMKRWHDRANGADVADGASGGAEGDEASGRKDTSFASEAMEEENPCAETKMVT